MKSYRGKNQNTPYYMLYSRKNRLVPIFCHLHRQKFCRCRWHKENDQRYGRQKVFSFFCAIYIDKNFVNVDGTILIKAKCNCTSNGIDITEIKSIGNDTLATNYVFVSVHGALCAYIKSNEFYRCTWHTSCGYVYTRKLVL